MLPLFWSPTTTPIISEWFLSLHAFSFTNSVVFPGSCREVYYLQSTHQLCIQSGTSKHSSMHRYCPNILARQLEGIHENTWSLWHQVHVKQTVVTTGMITSRFPQGVCALLLSGKFWIGLESRYIVREQGSQNR